MTTHYEGNQWRVTDDGIEQRGGDYLIRMRDLSMPMGEGGWIGHMQEKSWVDMEDFKRALSAALAVSSTPKQETGGE